MTRRMSSKGMSLSSSGSIQAPVMTFTWAFGSVATNQFSAWLSRGLNWKTCIRCVTRISEVRKPCGSRSRIRVLDDMAPGPISGRPANSAISGPIRWPWTSASIMPDSQSSNPGNTSLKPWNTA